MEMMDKLTPAFKQPVKSSRVALALMILSTDLFVLGGYSNAVGVVFRGVVFFLFLEFFVNIVVKNAYATIFVVVFTVLGFWQLLHATDLVHVTLELTLLLQVYVLVALRGVPKEMATILLKASFVISFMMVVVQFSYYYSQVGVGMLLRGDRNHTGLILTGLMFSGYYIYRYRFSFVPFFLPFNFSRNFGVGILSYIFLLNYSGLIDRYKYIIVSFLVLLVYVMPGLYVFAAGYLGVNSGSENDISRLLVVFDGSNAFRFKLNSEFFNLIISDVSGYALHTGVYGDLKDIIGLYPHNAYLQLIYRAGWVRFILFLLLMVWLMNDRNAAFVVTLMVQGMFLHDIFLTNILIMAYLAPKLVGNNVGDK